MRWLGRWAAVVVVSAGMAVPAFGSGFGIFVQGASPLGQADAVIAHEAGPSALFFNPALMTRLPGTQVEGGTTLIFPDREFRSPTGGTTNGERDFHTPSTFYLTHALDERWSVGLGVFSPFGLGTDWPEEWEGRYLSTKSQITTYTINPALAWRLAPNVSIAAGIDYLLFDARLENILNTGVLLGMPSGSADSRQKFEGDGDGWGYNLGLLVDLTDRLSFGASYRSEIEVEAEGEVSFDRATPLLATALPDTDAETTITLPQQAFAGLAWRPLDRLTLEGGVRWEDWSSFDDLEIHFDRPVLGGTISSQPKKWKDTFSYLLGAEYRLTDHASLLAGYLYGENAIPSETFEPSIPESDTHLVCLGSAWRLEQLRFALTYAYQLYEERKKNNTLGDPLGSQAAGRPVGTANGDYESELHMVALSASWRF